MKGFLLNSLLAFLLAFLPSRSSFDIRCITNNMSTFSQSDALQAACTLAISSFSSDISALVIKEKINETLNCMLQNPINSRKARPVGWRLRATHHKKSVSFFRAMRLSQSFRKRNIESLLPALENIMGMSTNKSKKLLQSPDNSFVSDISQVVRYKFEKTIITDVNSLPFPECPHLVISETSESSSTASSNATSPSLHSNSITTDLLPVPTNTTLSSPYKRNQRSSSLVQSSVISAATIRESIRDDLDGFVAFKKQFPLFNFRFTSLQDLASMKSIDVWVSWLTFQSQVGFSNTMIRIAQVILAKSWTRQMK